MANKKQPLMVAASLIAGLGAGNMTAQPDVIQLPAPEPIVIQGETVKVEVPVRFEELRHTADESLREAFDMPDAKNADLVAMNDSKDALIEKLRSLNKQASVMLTGINAELEQSQAALQQAKNQMAAVDQYQAYKNGVSP